jgi:hypothetical protein
MLQSLIAINQSGAALDSLLCIATWGGGGGGTSPISGGSEGGGGRGWGIHIKSSIETLQRSNSSWRPPPPHPPPFVNSVAESRLANIGKTLDKENPHSLDTALQTLYPAPDRNGYRKLVYFSCTYIYIHLFIYIYNVNKR